jgi:ribosome recycling factor
MEEEIKMVIEMAEETMKKSIDHLESELLKIRAGKASPVMLDGVRVEYYGVPTPLNQVANVSTLDARTLVIQPFDRKALHNIERAIVAANLGLNPSNDGMVIRIPIPALNEERRRQLVRQAKDEGEQAKVAIRNVRREHNEQLKSLKEEGFSEDQIKRGETKIQELTDHSVHKIDDILKRKEADILTV